MKPKTEKTISRFDQATHDNQEKAKFDEKVEERSLDIGVYNKLINMSYEWRHVEMGSVIFSIFGLILAIVDFEINLNYEGYRGLLLIHDNGPNTAADIAKAIAIRVATPKTQMIRWMNAMSSVVAIIFLVWRRADKTKWGNEQLR